MAIDDESPPLRVNTTRGGAMVTSFFFFCPLAFLLGRGALFSPLFLLDGWMDGLVG
jgi:hypothetical protein